MGRKSLEIFSHNSFLKYATVTSFFLLVLLIYQNDWKKSWSTLLRWTFKKEDGSEDAPNMLFWIMLTDLNRNKKITSAFNAPGMNVIGRSSGPVGPVNNMKCVWNEPRDVFRTRSSLYHTNSHLIRPSSRQRFGFTSKKTAACCLWLRSSSMALTTVFYFSVRRRRRTKKLLGVSQSVWAAGTDIKKKLSAD